MKYEICSRRLLEAMNDIGIKQRELADKAQIAESSVSHYVNGSHAPSNKTAGKLADILGVSPVWLMGFDVPKYHISQTSRSVRIPVYGRVAAGIPMEATENIIDYEEIPASWPGEYAALKVKGDSMEPKISEGDILIVRIQQDAESGDIVIAMVNGSDATVKKLIKHDSGIVLQPFNPAYEPMYYTHEQAREIPVTIWGKVVENRAKF